MVMVTLDIPRQINKGIEHFKVEHELKDKRDAIIMILEKCMVNQSVQDSKGRITELRKLFKDADKTKRHNLTPEQLQAMDIDIYD